MTDYDLLIKNGRIIDGTGSPWYRADVGIREGKIETIGKIDSTGAEETINADDFIVSPGFIDIHNHCDVVLLSKTHPETLAPYIRQGITTLVIGNCGISPAPTNEESRDLMKRYVATVAGEESLDWNWLTFDDYLRRLENQGVLFNVAPLVGHGAIRFCVMGAKSNEPDCAEMAAMKSLLDETMKKGAFGMSVGLIYPPGMWSTTDELVELAKVVAKHGGILTSHVRGSSELAVASEGELIEIAEKSKVRTQRSHHEACGTSEDWKKVLQTMEMEENARERGVDIASDVIPYPYANTSLRAIFPPWALEGGLDRLLERLQTPEIKKRIRKDVEELVPSWPPWLPGSWPHNLARSFGWQNIYVLSAANEKNRRYEGKHLVEIAEVEKMDPFEAAVKLTIEGNGNVRALFIGVGGDLQDETYLRYLLRHRLTAVCLDAVLIGRGMPHPAAYGAFPRLLGHYSRDERLFTAEEAIRKITSLPASRILLSKRGILKEGIFADITIFDVKKMRDNTTHLEPTREPQGVEYVIINGTIVLESGKYEPGMLKGKVLRKNS
jgi:N-acyl-D-amino-acid deacylase